MIVLLEPFGKMLVYSQLVLTRSECFFIDEILLLASLEFRMKYSLGLTGREPGIGFTLLLLLGRVGKK